MGLLAGCAPLDWWRAHQLEQHKSEVPVTRPIALEKALLVGEVLPGGQISDPFSLNLDIPFYSQAPQGDWGMPYQEACEEASLLLAWYYVTGQDPSIEKFEEDLLAMIQWEVGYFGQYEHTTIEQTAEMAKLYLTHENIEVVDDPTVEQIHSFLDKGYPVVAPFAGRYLGNPYFTAPGPVYHMLVIKGYTAEIVITNDPGTRRGADYQYNYDTLYNAIHDWNDGDVENGEKMMIVVKKITP